MSRGMCKWVYVIWWILTTGSILLLTKVFHVQGHIGWTPLRFALLTEVWGGSWVLATICEELPADSIVLLYLSASGMESQCTLSITASSGTYGEAESHTDRHVIDTSLDANSVYPMSSPHDSPVIHRTVVHEKGHLINGGGGLLLSSRGNRGFEHCLSRRYHSLYKKASLYHYW